MTPAAADGPPRVIVIGLLSGTSVDAIDVAAAEFAFGADGVLTVRPLGDATHPWPARLRERILAALPPAVLPIGEVCALDTEIGQVFGEVAASAARTLAGGRADLVASLGQTVFHDVRDGVCHGTLQLGQPAWIAEATGLPVVSDLRATDVAAGGHGAPLAGTLDALWLAGDNRATRPLAAGALDEPGDGARVALNLGGIANVTVVRPGRPLLAFDTGPANCLLDVAAARVTSGARTCDLDGELALAGTARADLLAVLLDEPYFALPPPRSCGRELFSAAYLDRALAAVAPVSGPDLLATLTEFTALTVAGALAPYRPTEVVLSGGGARNPALVDALRRALPGPLYATSAAHGLPEDAKEALLVALLGALTWHHLPGTVPSATGARRPTVLGRITPARGTPPTAPAPTSLRIVRGR
ncbi:MAG TPA: anhydro-N-acetylmuramic acid kinase [Pseudonocardiaceae bacterium]